MQRDSTNRNNWADVLTSRLSHHYNITKSRLFFEKVDQIFVPPDSLPPQDGDQISYHIDAPKLKTNEGAAKNYTKQMYEDWEIDSYYW